MDEYSEKIANEIGEYIKGIREIKAFNLTSHTFGKLSQSINSSVKWIKIMSKLVQALGWYLVGY